MSAGANFDVADKVGRTPLGKAAATGNYEAVVALVEAGADLNKFSSQNSSDYILFSDDLIYRAPLAWAALKGHEYVVKFLFDSGAEWRFLQKEPALSYTHGLLMQSWFPEDAQAFAHVEPFDKLPSVPPGNGISKSDTADTSQ